jgi:hypothetical protein
MKDFKTDQIDVDRKDTIAVPFRSWVRSCMLCYQLKDARRCQNTRYANADWQFRASLE